MTKVLTQTQEDKYEMHSLIRGFLDVNSTITNL